MTESPLEFTNNCFTLTVLSESWSRKVHGLSVKRNKPHHGETSDTWCGARKQWWWKKWNVGNSTAVRRTTLSRRRVGDTFLSCQRYRLCDSDSISASRPAPPPSHTHHETSRRKAVEQLFSGTTVRKQGPKGRTVDRNDQNLLRWIICFRDRHYRMKHGSTKWLLLSCLLLATILWVSQQGSGKTLGQHKRARAPDTLEMVRNNFNVADVVRKYRLCIFHRATV